jgi:hypothetical protein
MIPQHPQPEYIITEEQLSKLCNPFDEDDPYKIADLIRSRHHTPASNGSDMTEWDKVLEQVYGRLKTACWHKASWEIIEGVFNELRQQGGREP